MIPKKLFSDDIEVPSILSNGYIPSLDGIRALSIAIVIIAHINNSVFHIPILTQIFGFGTLGVHVFFVISGFLITTLLLKEKSATGNINLKKFYIRRFLRILPVAFLFLLVIFIFNSVFNLGMSIDRFLYQLTFTENFNLSPNPYTYHFWSLSVEEQFYLIFPFILKKSLRVYLATAFLIIIAYPIIVVSKFHFSNHEGYLKSIITYLDIFFARGLVSIMCGSIFTILLCKYPVFANWKFKWINLTQFLMLFLIWYLFSHKLAILPAGTSGIVVPVLISLFIFTLISQRDSLLFKFFNLKYLMQVGVLSYSLYIWQQIFTVHLPWKGYSIYSDSLLLNLVLMVVVAYLSYNFYEKPFLLFKKRFETVKNTHLP